MKARDLRGKNIEDLENDSSEPKEEEDAVAAAYENISKKLESIRNGKNIEDNDEEPESQSDEKPEDEPELEEWKGPRLPMSESKESDESEQEHELRKVNLRNLEDSKMGDMEGEGDQEEKDGEESQTLDDDGEKKDWEPKKDDPLDEEEDNDGEPESRSDEKDLDDIDALDRDNDEEEIEEEEDKRDEGKEEDRPQARRDFRDEAETETVESKIDSPRETNFDGPEESDEKAIKREISDEEAERGLPKREVSPDTLDDLTQDSPGSRSDESEEEYFIPHLKGSRQDVGNIGYNAPQERGSLGSSYQREPMENSDPNNYFSSHQPQPPKRANKFHLLILVVIGIVVIGFTVYILKGGFGDINIGTPEPSPSPSATATPEPTPTPTPEPEVNRGDFTIRVLNGTSTSGLAKTVNDKLKTAGYKTASPGNAENSDFEQTEIRVKEGSQSAVLFERLKLDLAPDYDAKQGENLDEDSKNDAEVILGAK